ncbi:alpha-ketoacid dehydrogenase subunit beta [Virgibacillus siamensis]|uniref:Alpha-ketoacid dehydrogenase subunit beta n=1 Tax=Virgibacillus siamensis TaxID=480071 RepID=A0ABP3QVW0_9BACI
MAIDWNREVKQPEAVKSMTMIQAINDAMKTMLELDDSTLVLGEDVGKNGGVFRATDGLQELFGEDRIVDTPLAESGIIGTSVGLAVNGFKPIAEIQFMGFIYPAYNQIMTHVSRIRMKTMGHFSVPMVIRAPYGAGIRAPEVHSDSMEAIFTHMPGLKVVCPSSPAQAKGLLIASIEDPDPVLFLEPMHNYRASREDVPTRKYLTEIGKGRQLSEGTDVSVIAWGAMIPVVEKAVKKAEQKGIYCDIIDVQTLYPLDRKLIAESVKKTGRAVIVHEAQATGGFGEHIASTINDKAFLYLRSPIERVAGFDVPVPFFALEDYYLPSADRVLQSIEKAVYF